MSLLQILRDFYLGLTFTKQNKSEYKSGLNVIRRNRRMGLSGRGVEVVEGRWVGVIWECESQRVLGDEHRDSQLRRSSTLISGRLCQHDFSQRGFRQSKGLGLQCLSCNVHPFFLSCSLHSFLPQHPPLYYKKQGLLVQCRIAGFIL